MSGELQRSSQKDATDLLKAREAGKQFVAKYPIGSRVRFVSTYITAVTLPGGVYDYLTTGFVNVLIDGLQLTRQWQIQAVRSPKVDPRLHPS